MANENFDSRKPDVGTLISQAVSKKIEYLSALKQAVADHQDAKVYELLDNQRYAAEIEHREQQKNDSGIMNLVDDLADQLSNYLSKNLIDYLGKAYPFFYYEEYQTGHYRIYFGNWWDRRQFGELDVLNIRFVFNQEEYKKLSESFKLSEEGKKYNSARIEQLSQDNDHLQGLIDSSTEREQERARLQNELKDATSRSGLFESSKNKEARQDIVDQISKLEDEAEEARGAKAKIKENNQEVLELSKEDTILSYEQKSILDVFGSFEDFELANRNLYANYLKHLSGHDDGKQVADNE